MDTPTQNVSTDYFKNKKRTGLILSLLFVLMSLIVTGALYIYNQRLEHQNQALQDEISQLTTSITEIEENPQVQIYSIYSKNKKFLNDFEKKSQIPTFITHLKKTLSRYRVEPIGFSYNDGMLKTDVSAVSESGTAAYQKLSTFISSYRADPETPFTLLPIEDFEGYDRITAPTSFELK